MVGMHQANPLVLPSVIILLLLLLLLLPPPPLLLGGAMEVTYDNHLKSSCTFPFSDPYGYWRHGLVVWYHPLPYLHANQG